MKLLHFGVQPIGSFVQFGAKPALVEIQNVCCFWLKESWGMGLTGSNKKGCVLQYGH